MRIVLLCVGRVRGEPFADDVAHYRRLLERRVGLEIIELREAAGGSGPQAEGLRKEAGTLLKRLPSSAFVCVADRGGEQLSSTGLARFLEERRRFGMDLWFVVGGPFGLDASVLERADLRLSFGRLTFPHELARVVLLEQLFRAHKILAGEAYHY